jgi:hypothetical protein
MTARQRLVLADLDPDLLVVGWCRLTVVRPGCKRAARGCTERRRWQLDGQVAVGLFVIV